MDAEQATTAAIDEPSAIHGLMAEFATATEILSAVRRSREAGYRQMDAYSPYPVRGLAEQLGMRGSKIPSLVLVGGLVGAAAGFFMQFYSMGVDYPLNVGGRPLNSWPVYIPVTFEVLVLVASLSAVLGLFYLNGLPQPYHPMFNVPEFARASQDRFFLCIEVGDPQFDTVETARFLDSLGPLGPAMVVPA